MAEPILPPNERMGAVQVVTAFLMPEPVLLPQSRIGCVQALIAAPIGLAMLDTVVAMLLPQPLRVCWAALMAPLSPVWIFAPTCTAKPLSLATAVLAKPLIFVPNGFQMASTPSRLRTRRPNASDVFSTMPFAPSSAESEVLSPDANDLNTPVVLLVVVFNSFSVALSALFASLTRSEAS